MKRRRILTLVLVLVACTLPLHAVISTDEPAAAESTWTQKRATELITHFMKNYHYKKTPLDDTLSAAILRTYLETLDPNRSYFTRQDIDSFRQYEYGLDDALRDGRLRPAFRIFAVFRKRLNERVSYAVDLLDREFDFEVDESHELDRSDKPWAPDRATQDAIWRKRVKNDVLSLRLAGQSADAIRSTLKKRYEGLARRTQQVDAEDIYQYFMNAYTTSVEPHTEYLSPRASENFDINMSLSLEGIGAVLQADNEYTIVRKVIPGGPAAHSGELQAEDRITGVGQGRNKPMVDVVGWRLDDVVDLIRGPKGSIVRLQVLPKGRGPESPAKSITLTRNKIELQEQAAKSSVIELQKGDNKALIGVIHVPTFYTDFAALARGERNYRSTTRDVRRLIENLVDKRGVDGIVVDLRSNGGGALSEATTLTGLFIQSGPVVQVKYSTGRIEVNDDPDTSIAYAGPLAILVDRHSASASEIFAAAIQDYHRGIIIGEPTFGKGTVQNLVNLDALDERSQGRLGKLKATVAQFFRINGESTQHRGVIPDIIYPIPFEFGGGGERDLDNALPWDSVQPVTFTRVRTGVAAAFAKIRWDHKKRIQSDPAFRLLLEEAEAIKEAQETTIVSLLESRRRAELEARERAQRERENRYRSALGLAPASEGNEAKENESELDEPLEKTLLVEAAKILGDLIPTTKEQRQARQVRDTSLADVARIKAD